MERSAHDGFINIDIAVPDFQVKTAIRIGANPGFVLNICPLTTEIGQRYQVSRLTTLTLGEIRLFHEVHLPTRIKFLTVYTTPFANSKGALSLRGNQKFFLYSHQECCNHSSLFWVRLDKDLGVT